MRYTEIYFTGLSLETTELLIAVLPDFGFSGMEELSNGLKAYGSESEVHLDELAVFAEQHSLVFTTAKIEEQNQIQEQNAQQALQRAHRAYVLETGKVVKEAKASDLLNDPDVRAAYLGTGAAGH